jgi:cytoskeletal protein RodZ
VEVRPVKWVLLIVIVLVMFVAFTVWRRMQADTARTAAPTRGSEPAAVAPPEPLSTPAAEQSVDEATEAPASEVPADGTAAPDGPRRPQDWWQDGKP